MKYFPGGMCFVERRSWSLYEADLAFRLENHVNQTVFLFNGTQYFYLTNQMGDVIGITDNTGSLIATYTYGAWGEVLAVTPATANNSSQLSIANANPLRYRGYYLDQESG